MMQERIEFGNNPKLISYWPGNPIADPYLGVHFHHWFPTVKTVLLSKPQPCFSQSLTSCCCWCCSPFLYANSGNFLVSGIIKVVWLAPRPIWVARFVFSWITRLVWLKACWWNHLPTERKEAGTKWSFLAVVWTLSKPAGKLHSYRYLCRDDLVIISALGPLSKTPLEYVLPWWKVLFLVCLFVCESKLILIAKLTVPCVRNMPYLLLVLSLVGLSILFYLFWVFLLFCAGFGFLFLLVFYYFSF